MITLVKAGDNLVFELSSHMFTFAGLNGVCEICHFCSVLVGERSDSSSPVKSLCPQCNMALKSLVSNLVSGQHSHDGHSTCLSDGHHGHAFGPMASSFTAFFPGCSGSSSL